MNVSYNTINITNTNQYAFLEKKFEISKSVCIIFQDNDKIIRIFYYFIIKLYVKIGFKFWIETPDTILKS